MAEIEGEGGERGRGARVAEGKQKRQAKQVGFISLFDFLYLVTFLSPIFG